MIKGWIAAAVLMTASADIALSAGYGDFTRGVTAMNLGEPDTAIAAFTAALDAGDLAAPYVPAAHRGRARAYMSKNMCAQAVFDFDAAMAAHWQLYSLLISRAHAKLCAKDVAGAQADFEQSVAAAANVLESGSTAHFLFAQAQWSYGFFAEAIPNLEHALALEDEENDHSPYTLLWYAVVADRAGKLDPVKLATRRADLPSREWPAPLLDLYLSKLDVQSVVNRSGDDDPKIGRGRKCEADFFIAEWHLARHNVQAALPLLESASAGCPSDYDLGSKARAELKRQAAAHGPVGERP